MAAAIAPWLGKLSAVFFAAFYIAVLNNTAQTRDEGKANHDWPHLMLIHMGRYLSWILVGFGSAVVDWHLLLPRVPGVFITWTSWRHKISNKKLTPARVALLLGQATLILSVLGAAIYYTRQLLLPIGHLLELGAVGLFITTTVLWGLPRQIRRFYLRGAENTSMLVHLSFLGICITQALYGWASGRAILLWAYIPAAILSSVIVGIVVASKKGVLQDEKKVAVAA